MKKILFLCTGNSCRSQMAEAFARLYFPQDVAVYSAGIEKHGLNPMMLQVMDEFGIDMTLHSSKTVGDLPITEWDTVVTVCAHAEEHCPFLPARNHLHLPFDDPPALVKGLTNREEILNVYRRVRDEIKTSIRALSMKTLE